MILGGVAICTILAMVDGGKVSAQGQEGEKEAFGAIFVKTDAMIPMRDGVKLHTEIYAPKNAAEKLPLFITRTPYGLADDDAGYSRLLGLYRELVDDGYLFAFQDIRGRFHSEGEFVMLRPPRDPARSEGHRRGHRHLRHHRLADQERADNNGRVGMRESRTAVG